MEKTIEQLKPMFNAVAEKIGQGAEFGWEVVLRQQFAYGIKDVIVALIMFAVVITIITLSIKMAKWLYGDAKGDMDDALGPVLVVILIPNTVSVFMLCGAVSTMARGILHLMNPAYYALEFFINLVK